MKVTEAEIERARAFQKRFWTPPTLTKDREVQLMAEYAKQVAEPLIADDESNGAEIMRLKTAYDAEVTDNMRLREALEHYADESNWSASTFSHSPAKREFQGRKHGYSVAQAALKEAGDGK